MRSTPDDELVAAFLDFLPHVAGGPELLARVDAPMRAKLTRAMPGLKERAKTLLDLMKSSQYLFASRPLMLDDKARQIMADGGIAALQELLPVLSAAEWNAQSLEAAVKTHAEATGAKLGKLAQPLRAVLTGTNTSPGIFDVLDVLGREESLNRIGDAVKLS
jgi:glutamyl-tRNA synthetase